MNDLLEKTAHLFRLVLGTKAIKYEHVAAYRLGERLICVFRRIGRSHTYRAYADGDGIVLLDDRQ